ncbi:MAG: GTPase HflX [candidate division Zixibacteria bacterium]|nr:GTPase HflX [candidate division Zixibacteria bacterium]
MYETGNDNRAERVILIGTALGSTSKDEAEYAVDELARLTATAGGLEVARFIQKRDKPDGAYFIGRGLAEQVAAAVEETEADLVVFDELLSPNQQRNLGEKFNVKVIDRAMLILDIFALHARSAEARLQVELAQMVYLLPRLTGLWVHLSRQQGGIGTKGPGETQLETDRRAVTKKIAALKERLKKIDRQRQTQRKGREGFFKIALVGYTNAGKSTLFNCLTKAGVAEADQLFSTLDSTTRRLAGQYPQKAVLTDTVGFIEKLPHQLVASFRATLEEVKRADLVLLVVDCSDPYLDRKIGVVERVLGDIGAARIPRLTVYNKTDLLAPEAIVPAGSSDGAIPISATQRVGLNRLLAAISVRLEQDFPKHSV